MLKQIPVKKEYLFIASVIVLLLVSYRFAFKRTIEAWQVRQKLQAQLAQGSDLSIQPAYLARKDNNLSSIINLYKTDTAAFRSNIISKISFIAEKEQVKLSGIPVQNPLYNTDKFIIQKLDFEGDFFALTKVLNQLQTSKDIGMLRSFTYRVAGLRQNSDEGKKLVLAVYLQSVK